MMAELDWGWSMFGMVGGPPHWPLRPFCGAPDFESIESYAQSRNSSAAPSTVMVRGLPGVQRSLTRCSAMLLSSESSGLISVGRSAYQPWPMRDFGYGPAVEKFSGMPRSRARRMTFSIAAV